MVSDVWTDIHRIKHNTKRDPHPCQLPIHLMDRLILMTTDENDIVFDPFSGTGTTAISAKRLGRKYVGFELDAKYVEISQEKLEHTKPNFKIGGSWVSFYLKDIVTIRNNDWNNIEKYFIIPNPLRSIDYERAKLKDKKLIPDENGVPHVLKLPIKELEETIYAASTQSGTLSVHAKLFHDLKPLKSLPIANALKQNMKR